MAAQSPWPTAGLPLPSLVGPSKPPGKSTVAPLPGHCGVIMSGYGGPRMKQESGVFPAVTPPELCPWSPGARTADLQSNLASPRTKQLGPRRLGDLSEIASWELARTALVEFGAGRTSFWNQTQKVINLSQCKESSELSSLDGGQMNDVPEESEWSGSAGTA